MGHTVWSQRMTLDVLLAELKKYGKALRPEDREALERLLKQPLRHVGSIAYASSMHLWAFLILSILIEQEKRYESLADRRVSEQRQDCPLVEDT